MITTKIHKLSLLEFATSCTRPFHCRCILATKMKGVNVAKTPGSMLFIKEHVKGFVKKKAKLCGCIQENCKTYVLGLCIWAFDNKVFSVRFLSLETFGHEQQNISVFLPNSLVIANLCLFFYFLTFEKADCSIFTLLVGWSVGWLVGWRHH